jgi:hypothetical protein
MNLENYLKKAYIGDRKILKAIILYKKPDKDFYYIGDEEMLEIMQKAKVNEIKIIESIGYYSNAKWNIVTQRYEFYFDEDIDIFPKCINCGDNYNKSSNRQKYCKKCSPNIIRAQTQKRVMKFRNALDHYNL